MRTRLALTLAFAASLIAQSCGGGSSTGGGGGGGDGDGGMGGGGGTVGGGGGGGTGGGTGGGGGDLDAGTMDAGEPPPPESCGDGEINGDPVEECDDGDVFSNDGCSSQCVMEDGWVCYDPDTDCERCGNGIVELHEQCDDGPVAGGVDGDGCSASCQLEDPEVWTCDPNGTPCYICGDGTRAVQEGCDDGGKCVLDGTPTGESCTVSASGDTCATGTCEPVGGDGCAANCIFTEPNWLCDVVNEPTECIRCGNGTIEQGAGGTPSEECDDGGNSGSDGCSAVCTVEPGWNCPPDGGACAECSDGEIHPTLETCDDRNRTNGDGCSSQCQTEGAPFYCHAPGLPCEECGNDVVEDVETCDDGNFDPDDGCSAACQSEGNGWICPAPGQPCNRCGDGALQGAELCDDGAICVGGTNPGAACLVGGTTCNGGTCTPQANDGCKADCSGVEENWDCGPDNVGPCYLCGNGEREDGEECDDGDNVSGDGCSRTCVEEPGAVCYEGLGASGEDVCEVCDNGVVEAHEACDDSNDDGGDGCSADCQEIEPGYLCPLDGFPCYACHDGNLNFGEECDDGGSCDSDSANFGAACTTSAACAGGACRNFAGVCVGGTNAGLPCDVVGDCPGGSACAPDGCNATCELADHFICEEPGTPCEECGDGVDDPNEECDDGNHVAGDGCSPTCTVEPGSVCTGSTCFAAECGDGVRAGSEECDDENTMSGDGCSILCKVEEGSVCVGSIPSVCHDTECGDGTIEGAEECDQGGGNVANGDGCDSSCQVEIGFACTGAPSSCVTETCGNGVIAGAEECDDGGNAAPGCDASCQLEDGYYCPTAGAACVEEICGNGVVRGNETCDDGNTRRGTCNSVSTNAGAACTQDSNCTGANPDRACEFDGCYQCQVEPLFDCTENVSGLSSCSPLTMFRLVRRWDINSINPVGMIYDPETRSFVGWKDSLALNPVELCLDGTVIDYGGTVYPAGSTVGQVLCRNLDGDPQSECAAGPRAGLDCTSADQCRRARSPADVGGGASYDPFTGNVLWLSYSGNPKGVLYQATLDNSRQTALSPAATSEQLFEAFCDAGTNNGQRCVTNADCPGGGGASCENEELPLAVAIAIGEDGRLYVLLGDGEVLVYDRDGSGATVFATRPSESFDTQLTNGAINTLFLIPGTGLLGTHSDLVGDVYGSELVFHFYETDGEFVGSSTIPGTFFEDSTNPDLVTYGNPVNGSAAATDGSGFITCGTNNSDDCQLFARACTTDADCTATLPGTSCIEPDANNTPCDPGDSNCYCTATADARDDSVTVDRNSVDAIIDVLDNDSRSLATCQDNTVRITNVCAFGVDCCEEPPATSVVGSMGGTATISADGSHIEYDAPADFCSSTRDKFSYCAELGGNQEDHADVRVLIGCICGDGIVQSNEQCDVVPPDDGDNDGCEADCTFRIICGDGIVHPGEQCDDLSSPGADGHGCSATCQLETVCGNGTPENASDAEGVEQCDDGNNTSGDGCSDICRCPKCGNGILEFDATDDPQCPGSWTTEQCDDGNNLPGDGCSATCLVETACGNGVLDGSEECDDGGNSAGDGCSATCAIEPVCGDGVTEGSEDCDLGGTCSGGARAGLACLDAYPSCPDGTCVAVAGPGCDDDCNIVAICGNGIQEDAEACDDGGECSNMAASCVNDAGCGGVPGSCVPQANDGCSATCEVEYCGDGTFQPGLIMPPFTVGEQCDDGNNVSGDGCNYRCEHEIRCGDGDIEGTEQCDDGGMCVGGGNAGNPCVLVGANVPTECPSGTCVPQSGDTCSATCRTEYVCGNNVVNPGEECDDGGRCTGGAMDGAVCDVSDPSTCPGGTCATMSGDGCSATCVDEAFCGDGMKDPGEQCDDGNSSDNDGCSASCLCPVCGNGVRETSRHSSCDPLPVPFVPEECDDGNASNFPCNDQCRFNFDPV